MVDALSALVAMQWKGHWSVPIVVLLPVLQNLFSIPGSCCYSSFYGENLQVS